MLRDRHIHTHTPQRQISQEQVIQVIWIWKANTWCCDDPKVFSPSPHRHSKRNGKKESSERTARSPDTEDEQAGAATCPLPRTAHWLGPNARTGFYLSHHLKLKNVLNKRFRGCSHGRVGAPCTKAESRFDYNLGPLLHITLPPTAPFLSHYSCPEQIKAKKSPKDELKGWFTHLSIK